MTVLLDSVDQAAAAPQPAAPAAPPEVAAERQTPMPIPQNIQTLLLTGILVLLVLVALYFLFKGGGGH